LGGSVVGQAIGGVGYDNSRIEAGGMGDDNRVFLVVVVVDGVGVVVVVRFEIEESWGEM
jgi:hypothetical protein